MGVNRDKTIDNYNDDEIYLLLSDWIKLFIDVTQTGAAHRNHHKRTIFLPITRDYETLFGSCY